MTKKPARPRRKRFTVVGHYTDDYPEPYVEWITAPSVADAIAAVSSSVTIVAVFPGKHGCVLGEEFGIPGGSTCPGCSSGAHRQDMILGLCENCAMRSRQADQRT